MRKFIIGIIVGFLLSTLVAYAGIINSPPPLPDTEVTLQQYLFEIWQNMNRPEIITTNPNGSRSGKVGDLISFNDSGTYKLFINTTGSTVWQQFTQL